MLTFALLAGLWSSTCIQTQSGPGKQGFVIESFYFEENGSFEFTREWFDEAHCGGEPKAIDSEVGTLEIGKKLDGMFISGPTFEADFHSESGVDLGAISVEGNKLKVARGMKNSSMRNTMLGIFGYIRKQ